MFLEYKNTDLFFRKNNGIKRTKLVISTHKNTEPKSRVMDYLLT